MGSGLPHVFAALKIVEEANSGKQRRYLLGGNLKRVSLA